MQVVDRLHGSCVCCCSSTRLLFHDSEFGFERSTHTWLNEILRDPLVVMLPAVSFEHALNFVITLNLFDWNMKPVRDLSNGLCKQLIHFAAGTRSVQFTTRNLSVICYLNDDFNSI